MSDTYSVGDYMAETGRDAQALNYGAMDENPEDAARAIELGGSSGIPSPAIYGDLESFERTYKAALGSHIIQNNSHIANYLTSDPMAAKVSHDDLGNLDEVSEKLGNLPTETALSKWLKSDSIAESFMSRFGEQPFNQESIEKATGLYSRPNDIEFALSHPILSATIGRAVGLGELGLEANARVLNGLIGAGRDGIAKIFGEGTANTFDTAAQALIDPATQETLMGAGPAGAIPAGMLRGAELLGDFLKAYRIAKPFAKVDKEVPAGLHPLIDETKKIQAREDASALDDALSAAAKSATRERAPDLFANFIRDHIGDREIGIAPEAVRSLYGDDIPYEDDGKLGFVPDLQSKLEAAEFTGDDVQVSLPDWLAKVDPEIAKQLHDDIRVRDGGLTINESKIEAEPKEVIPDPVAMIRSAGGMEPLASVGDRKITLQRMDEARSKEVFGDQSLEYDEPVHDLDILDESGKPIGFISVSERNNGKQLWIHNIQAGPEYAEFYQPQYLGPGLVRDLARQLKAAYPKAVGPDGKLSIGGYRVTGARDRANKIGEASIKFDLGDDPQAFRDLLQPYWDFLNPQSDIELLRGPLGEEGKKINADVMAELNRIAPQANKEVVHSIFFPKAGGSAAGLWSPRLQKIFVSLESKGAVGTARHEAIHSLRGMDLIREDEWLDLKQAAKEGGWRDRFNIDKNYKNFTEDQKDEEAIAEAYRAWRNGEDIVKDTSVFQRIKDFIDMVHRRIKEALGRDFTWEEIFKDIDTGRIGRREQPFEADFGDEAASIEQFRRAANDNYLTPEEREMVEDHLQAMRSGKAAVDKLTDADADEWSKVIQKILDHEKDDGEQAHIEEPTGEEPGFGIYNRGKTLGITQAHNDRMLKLAQQLNSEDFKAAQRRAEVRQRRRSNREYKERRTALRDEVSNDLQQRPDIATDRLFAKQKIKLDPAYLTEDQRARLPKDYIQKKDGVNPDDLAPYFGYSSGDALVERLGMLTEDRRRAGMSHRDYFNRLVDVETDRRLNQEFGDREQNILDEAKDQALSETQLNLIHEETMAYAYKVHGQDFVPQFNKDQVHEMVRTAFNSVPVGSISSDRLIQNAGKIGKKIEEAGSKGDWAEAYRLSQQRNHSMIAAKFARDYEKQREQTDRLYKTYRKQPTKETARKIDQDYYNFVQGLFARFGQRIGRTEGQLAEAIEQSGYKDLSSFVKSKTEALRELYLPEFLTDPTFKAKTLDELTYDQFNQLHRFLKQMDFNARDEKTINREGEKADKDATIAEMIDSMPSTLPTKPTRIDTKERKIAETGKSMWWSHVTLRSMAKRLDQGNPKGLFTRLIADRATEADARDTAMWKEYSQRLEQIGKPEDMDKKVDNNIFIDPNTGQPLLMRKRNIYGMIANWGNNNNRTKLLKGWNVTQEDAEAMLRRNSTPEDWERAQKIGDVFRDAFRAASNMSREVSGVGIDRLPIEEFTDPHGGVQRGWYNPVEYSDLLPGTSKELLGANAIERPGYFRATPSSAYAKARTGYIAPMDLNLDAIPVRLRQMIHDISWRSAIVDMGKIIYDQKFQRAMISRYGRHQMEEFKSYLKDMANGSNVDSLSEYYREGAFEYLRRNTVATLIGLNPSTFMKHSLTAATNSLTQVGPENFAREFAGMFRGSDEYGDSQLKMAYDKSEVIQDRMQNITRLIRGQDPKFTYEPNKFGALRDIMMHVGSFPVAIGDFASAVPTWLAEYKKQIAKGENEGFSIQAADKAVIEAHGSSMRSNLPSVMREGGAMARTYSSLYGFFSHMLQKQYEFAWKAKDIWNGEKPMDIEGHWAPHMLGNLWSYWLAPALIEELITPYTNKEKESWGMKAVKTIGIGATASLLYVRDFARALFGTYGDPQAGLLGTSFKTGTDLAHDLQKHQPISRQNMGKVIKDAVTLTGILSGLTNAQEGRTGEYIYRYSQKLEKPKGPWDLATGARYGDTKGHPKTFAEWWKHMTK